MFKSNNNSDKRIIIMLLFAGAIPALPGAYILFSILQGPTDIPNEMVQPHYFKTPLPIVSHIIAGFFFFLLAPFQFSRKIRSRHTVWHRGSGRLLMVAGLIMAVTGLWMIHSFPSSGSFPRYSGLFATSVGMIITLALSLQAILKRNIARHRVWIIRAIAITYGAVAPALIIIPIYLLFGEVDEAFDEWSRWVGMGLNLIAIEWIFYRERQKAIELKTRAQEAGA